MLPTFPLEHKYGFFRVLHHVEVLEELHQLILMRDQQVLIEIGDSHLFLELVRSQFGVEDKKGRVVLEVVVDCEEFLAFNLILILVKQKVKLRELRCRILNNKIPGSGREVILITASVSPIEPSDSSHPIHHHPHELFLVHHLHLIIIFLQKHLIYRRLLLLLLTCLRLLLP